MQGFHSRFFKVSILGFILISCISCATGLDDEALKIVGGEDTSIVRIPFQVSIQDAYSQPGIDAHFCGGAIIDEYWIVTAAHCTEGSRPRHLKILAGTSRLKNWERKQFVEVSEIIQHPNYRPLTLRNDIALIRLESPLELGSGVEPAILASNNESSDYYADLDTGITAPGQKLSVSGWGALSEGSNSTPNRLQRAWINVIAHEEGEDLLEENIPNSQLLAGVLAGGVDSCQGDSGGPLTEIRNGQDVLVGIVSWGIGCAREDMPGVYTRISSYHDWIQEQLGNPGDEPGDDDLCTNTCYYASDGLCDDGGPGSDYDLCELGTDCDDCGPR